MVASRDACGSFTAVRSTLVLCGFTAVVGQIVLMRELIQVFNGNEIALGILLATWLLWTAFGSALASAFMRSPGAQTRRARLAVAALEALLALSLPATIWALQSSRSVFQTVPGELVGPVPMLVTSFAGLSVFCAVTGALFVAAARLVAGEGNLSARSAASVAYLLEAVGSAFGGVLASVVFVRFLDAFQIAGIVGLLNFAVPVALLFRLRRAQAMLLATAAAVAAIPMLVWVAPRCNTAANARLWRGFHVVAARDSIYGNLTVTQTGENETDAIRSLYENGSILASAPDPASAEEAVDYALLEHPAPRRVLLIGGGVNGSVAEALKHPTVESVDYVELDPALIGLAEQYFPAQTAAFRCDSRVHLHFLDGRRFLSESREKFDVIIVDLPDPQTAQLNRFYTLEFFRLARAHLAPGGLVGVELRSSEEIISPDLAAFLRSIRATLSRVFSYQAAIPGEIIHFFGAVEPGVLTQDPRVLVARLRERHLHTQYVSEYILPFRMTPDRMEQVETALAPRVTTPVNRDFMPVAYAFDVIIWSEQFKSSDAAWFDTWFRLAHRVSFGKVAGGLGLTLLIAVALFALLPCRERRERAAAGFCVAATGFTLMALQIFLLLGFQAVYGYVYTELAILIGLFMAGMALGSWLGMRRHGASGGWTLTATQFLIAVAGPALLLAVSGIGDVSSHAAAWLAVQIVFPALAALAGGLGGFQFVTAAGIFLGGSSASARLGLLYAMDLLGGCAGALALSTLLIPIFGFWRTAWLAAAINAAAVLLAMCVSLGWGSSIDADRSVQSS